MTLRRSVATAAVAAAVGMAASGCALGTAATTAAHAAGNDYAFVAVAVGRQLAVHRTPDGPVSVQLANPNVYHAPLVLLATARYGNWLKVLLPLRPNGSFGWVPESQVRLTWTPWHVLVTVHTHTLTLYDGSRRVLETKAGVGSRSTPTPLGEFYLTSLLVQPDPHGDYGPYAFGLSGYSPVLKHFAGGDAEIGLHGTDAAWSIGKSVTHGCIRVSNRVITLLAQRLPLGTPVTVVP